MKKNIFILLLFFCTVIYSQAQGDPGVPQKLMFVSSENGLKLRATPGLDGNVIRVLSHGEPVVLTLHPENKVEATIDGIRDYWHRVSTTYSRSTGVRQGGWVFGGYLTDQVVYPSIHFEINGFVCSSFGQMASDYLFGWGGLVYEQYDGIVITGYNGEVTDVVIPSIANDFPIVAIGDKAFFNPMRQNVITSVYIPDSIITIGNGAFSNLMLTKVTIGNSVTTIGIAAFAINKLINVTIPNSVTTISSHVFQENLLTNVIIPDSVTTIGEFAFCKNLLTNVTIPDFVTIDGGAFISNPITSITIGNNVTLNTRYNTKLNIEGGPYYTVFGNDFDNYYNSTGKKAGTYVLDSGQWNMR